MRHSFLASLPAILLAFFLPSLLPAASTQPRVDPDDGMEGSVRLGIPEPMVFDLVRPLGAEKGEFEVNVLASRPFRTSRTVSWAPEIEYAFRHGTAVEFELPMENSSVGYYKFAVQQKLPVDKTKPFTHGLQAFAEREAGAPHWNVTAVYIAGVRWHPRWSTLSMAGASRESEHRSRTVPVINHTVFHERWKRAALGIETNWKDPARPSRQWLLIPQFHFRLHDRINLQVGAGYTRRPGLSAPVVALRLIREL